MKKKIGLVQTVSRTDVKENIRTLQKYCNLAKAQDCHVLCFPEAFLTGYFPEKVSQQAITLESKEIRQVEKLALELEIDLLVGFMERMENKFCLTHGIFLADGKTEIYRKTHLGQKEKLYFSEGEKLDVFQLSGGIKAGFQICVENHFPEITQTLSLRGAEIIFAPYAVPGTTEKRSEVWRKIMPARSYDNRVYMACCNLLDEERFGGGCMVTDPYGEEIISLFEKEEKLITFLFEQEKVKIYHQSDSSMKYRYYPQYRRPELYELKEL